MTVEKAKEKGFVDGAKVRRIYLDGYFLVKEPLMKSGGSIYDGNRRMLYSNVGKVWAAIVEEPEITSFRLIKPEYTSAAVSIEGNHFVGSHLRKGTWHKVNSEGRKRAIKEWKKAGVWDKWFECRYEDTLPDIAGYSGSIDLEAKTVSYGCVKDIPFSTIKSLVDLKVVDINIQSQHVTTVDLRKLLIAIEQS
jgi:hypothetical protein